MRTRAVAVISAVAALVATAAVVAPMPASAAVAAPRVDYVYDAEGRVYAVVTRGEVGVYHYDDAGNIVSIDRRAAQPTEALFASPGDGAVGDVVTIHGFGFSATASEDAVSFGTRRATVVAATSTALTVRVPAGAVTGVVTVRDPKGVATTPAAFTVRASRAPYVSAVSPVVAVPGTALTLTGGNFAAEPTENVVRIEPNFATVTAATPTQLTVEYPPFRNATSLVSHVSVATVDGTALSPVVVTPPSPYGAGDVGIAAHIDPDGTTHSYTVDSSRRFHVVTFDATKGERVRMVLHTSSSVCADSVKLVAPDGSNLFVRERADNSSPCPLTSASDAVAISGPAPQTGSYVLRLDYGRGFTSAAGGPLDVTLSAVSDVQVSLQPGQDTTTTTPSKTVTISVPGQGARINFTASGPGRVFAKVNTCSAKLALYDATDTLLGDTMGFKCGLLDEPSFYAYLDTTAYPSAGSYYVYLSPDNGATGTYTITLYDVPPDVTASVVPNSGSGGTVTATIGYRGQNAAISFAGTAGQRIFTKLAARTDNQLNVCETKLSVVAPSGATLAGAQHNDQCSLTGGYTWLDTQTLGADGTYRVLVDPAAEFKGDFTVTVYDVPPDVVGTIAPDGALRSFSSSTPGQDFRFTFTGVAGRRVSMTVATPTVDGRTISDATMRLTGPTGQLVAFTTLSGSLSPPGFFDATVLPKNGEYTVDIDPANDDSGGLGVTLYDVPADPAPTVVLDGPAVPVTLNVPGMNAVASFAGTAGQPVSITIPHTVTNGCLSLSLRAPDGTQLAGDPCWSSSGFVDRFTLPATGTYTIRLDPQRAATGVVTIRAYIVPPDAQVVAQVNGAEVSVANTVPGQNMRVYFDADTSQVVQIAHHDDSGQACAVNTSWHQPNDNQVGLSLCQNGPLQPTYTGRWWALLDPTGPLTTTDHVKLADLAHPLAPPGAKLPVADANQQPGQDTLTTTPTVTVTIPDPGGTARVHFTSLTAGRVFVKVDHCTAKLSLRKDDGTLLGNTMGTVCGLTDASKFAYLDTTAYPSAGSYYVLVEAQGADYGDFKVTVYDVPPDATVAVVPTPAGVQATVTNSYRGQNARVTFTGVTGQRVFAKLTGCSAALTLLGPGDAPVGTARDDQCTTYRYVDATTLTATGTHTVHVDPPAEKKGDWTVTVYDVPPDVTSTVAADGVTRSFTSSTPGQNFRFTFAGTAGQRVSATVGTAAADGRQVVDAAMRLVGPSGQVVTSAALSGTLSPPGFLDAVALPATGTYALEIDPANDDSGTLAVTVYDVPADPTPAVTLAGPAVSIPLTTPGLNATATIAATAGQSVSIAIPHTVTGGCLALTLTSPWGIAVVNNTCWPANGFVDRFSVPATGTYTLRLDPQRAAVGTVTVTAYLVPADARVDAVVDGPAVTVSNTIPGQNLRVYFDASQSFTVSATYHDTSRDGCDVYLSWHRAADDSGYLLTTSPCDVHTFNPIVSQGGAWYLLIDPIGPVVLTSTVSLADLTTTPTALSNAVVAEKAATTSTTSAVKPHPAHPDHAAPDPKTRDGGPGNGAGRGLGTPGAGRAGLVGTVRDTANRPLRGVTLRVGTARAHTDGQGRFRVEHAPSGHQVLVIDGRTVRVKGRSYGVFESPVDLQDGVTAKLGYVSYLPPLDLAHEVTIPSPTTATTVITTPKIPGLQLRIPRGAVLRDIDGKVVTRVGITPIPINRTPHPLPAGVQVPIYYTIQPGGAYIAPASGAYDYYGYGAQIVYPNYAHDKPNRRAYFWHWDPEDTGWYVYGGGTVTADGTQVVPDRGVRIHELTGAMYSILPNNAPGKGSKHGKNGGDPVDLATGLFGYEHTDLELPDTQPLALTRAYRPDDAVKRAFGIGSMHPYETYLVSGDILINVQRVDLVGADGSRIKFLRTSAGTNRDGAVLRAATDPGPFYAAVMTWTGTGWTVRLRGGTVYAFDGGGALQSITDRHGDQVLVTREFSGTNGTTVGNVQTVRSPNGRWLRFAYDASNRVTSVKDNAGRTVTYTYDAGGRVATATDVAGGVTAFTYDASHRMTTIRDPRQIVFLTNEYDTSNRVTKQTLADGTTYQFAYTTDGTGAITAVNVTDPRGVVRKVEFDAAGHAVAETAAYGTALAQRTTYERQSGSELVTATVDARQRRTETAYDADGNLLSVTRLAGTADAVTAHFTYGAFGLLTDAYDTANRHVSMARDGHGNVTSTTDLAGGHTVVTYDPQGRPLTIAKPAGEVTTFTYGPADLAAVADGAGGVVTRLVDGAGRLLATTNALGERWTTSYNALGQPLRTVDPDGHAVVATYDANGNRLSLTDQRGHATHATYDAMDRVATQQDALGATAITTYDNEGRPLTVTDRRGVTTEMKYDALGRTTFVGYGRGGTQAAPTYDSTVDIVSDTGNRVTSVTDSATGTLSYGYDELDRVLTETTAAGTVTSSYLASGEVASLAVSGQPAVTYGYTDGRLSSVTQSGAGTAIDYDASGRRTALTQPNGVTTTYQYDPASRPSALLYADSTHPLGDLRYAYDPAGRPVTLTGTLATAELPAAQPAATYDDGNRLTALGAASLGYDADGNLTSDGTSTYTWNVRGQLTQVSGAGGTTSLGYDPAGRRIAVTAGGTTSSYRYAGSAQVTRTTSGVTYGQVDDPTSDGVLSTATENGTRYPLADALGSTVALTDANRAMRTSYSYEPYGLTAVSGQGGSTAATFTGRPTDADGLQYSRARYYSPSLRRFISEDPIGAAGGDVNLYAYVGGGATYRLDPTGMSWNPFSTLWHGLRKFGHAVAEVASDPLFLAIVGAATCTILAEACLALAIEAGIDGWLVAVAAGGGTALAIQEGEEFEQDAPIIAEEAEELQQTLHGAARAVDPSRLDAAAQADVIANATQRFTQANGAEVFVQEVDGKYNVVIQGANGVITNLKTISQAALDRLARNYGWR